MAAHKISIVPGTRYGHWTVVEASPTRLDRRVAWVCRCACGKVGLVTSSSLANARSTGCLSCARSVHGHKKNRRPTPEYTAWQRMQSRCTNPKEQNYRYYGGRGITVCEAWKGPGGFERFLEAMGPKPSPEYELDRLDNDRNYESGNCRWATRAQQSLNRRSAVMITIGNETLNLADWARRSGNDQRIITKRMRQGWEANTAVFTPRSQLDNPRAVVA